MHTLQHIREAQKVRTALENSLVKHRRFAEAYQRIESALLFPTDVRLLWVVGPTGAGKTRLLQAVERLIHKIVADKLVENPGAIPCISFEVPCPELGHRFSWPEYHARYLDKLDMPLNPTGARLPVLPKMDPKRGLEHAVLNGLKHRAPVAVLLDEVNHFASVTSAKVLFDQTNRIKSFVSRSKVLHICFGTYEMARMAAVSGQLVRRSDIIHLSRYRAESDADCADFRGAVCAFQEKLPLVHHLNLAAHAKYLHERSIGCVGFLKGWLLKALAAAYVDGRSEITLKDIENTAESIGRLRIMLDNALEGERALEDDATQLDLFRQELGHTRATDHVEAPALDLFSGQPSAPKAQPKSKSKPFEQSPARLPTGGAFNGEFGKLANGLSR